MDAFHGGLREFGDSTSKMPNLGNFGDAFELPAIENFGMLSVGPGICLIKNRSKHNSITLLSLLQIL